MKLSGSLSLSATHKQASGAVRPFEGVVGHCGEKGRQEDRLFAGTYILELGHDNGWIEGDSILLGGHPVPR
jgi:hypothetical protein